MYGGSCPLCFREFQDSPRSYMGKEHSLVPTRVTIGSCPASINREFIDVFGHPSFGRFLGESSRALGLWLKEALNH